MRQLVSLFLISLMFIGTASAAPSRVGKNDIGLNVSAAISQDDELDTAAAINGSFSHGVNEWFAVGLSAGWQDFESDSTTSAGITIDGTEITGVPLFVDLIARAPASEQSFTPYGVLGLGTVIWDIDETTATGLGATIATQTDVDTDFAVKVGGGVDWFVNENWAINFEAAYVFSNPEATVTATAAGTSVSVTDEIDLDYWTVGAGIKYLFS